MEKKLIKRLYKPEEVECESNPEGQKAPEENINNDLKSQFEYAISTAMTSTFNQEVQQSLGKEFSFFEVTGEKSNMLRLLFQALQTIKPTSTQNERTFFIAGRICTKIRSRLSDENLDIIVFLKYFF